MLRPALAVVVLVLTLTLVGCSKGETSAPCEVDGDCKGDLECTPARAPLSAAGSICSLECDADDECEGGLCLGSTCVRECTLSAPDCPEGSVCANWVIEISDPISGEPKGSELLGTFCVLPCRSHEDCTDADYPYCPSSGGPCASAMQ